MHRRPSSTSTCARAGALIRSLPVIVGLWCVCGIPALTLYAQEPTASEPISTDRPDFTESSSVVHPGIVQVETGMTFEVQGSGNEVDRTFTTPLALVRVGLWPRLELRVGSDGFVRDAFGRSVDRVVTSGLADLELAAKLVLRHPTDDGFALAVIPLVSLPTGSDGISSGTVDSTVKLTWEAPAPHGFSLAGNVNLSRLGDERGRYSEGAFSLSVGHDLSPGWSGYWEVFGFVPHDRPGQQAWTFDTGVSRAVGANMQWDIEGGAGLTSAAPNWFIGAGFAVRTSPFRRSSR